jgi:hypothetical protein
VRRLARLVTPYVLAALGTTVAHAAPCDWSKPGAAPYRGQSVETALAAYDMPEHARAEIAGKVKTMLEDGIALITRDKITSPQGSVWGLRDMHWSGGMCTGPVSRQGWAADRVEAALIYCSGPHCIAIPVVCGNVSRIEFAPRQRHEPELRNWDGRPVQVRTVPEPGTLLLSLLALGVMGVRK